MDTSDRQVAETGRNRELGLIPAMVMAVVATLSGAGVSFAPLYERIWGGMMLHPNCPAIGRMTYYLSGQATDDYGACVTSPLWFMTVTALSVVAILCLTVAGVQGFSRHRLCSVFSVLIAAVAVAIILVLSANTKIVTLWAMYAVTWLVHAIVTSYLSNGWIRIARLLFVWQIGVMRYSSPNIQYPTRSTSAAAQPSLADLDLRHMRWCNTPLLPSTRKTTVIESRQNAVVYGLPPCTTCSTPSASTHPPYAIALFPLPCSGQVSRSLPTATTLVDTPISAQRYRQLTMQVLSLIASAMKLWDC